MVGIGHQLPAATLDAQNAYYAQNILTLRNTAGDNLQLNSTLYTMTQVVNVVRETPVLNSHITLCTPSAAPAAGQLGYIMMVTAAIQQNLQPMAYYTV